MTSCTSGTCGPRFWSAGKAKAVCQTIAGRGEATIFLYHLTGTLHRTIKASIVRILTKKTIGYEVAVERSLDTDAPFDLQLAELIYSRSKNLYTQRAYAPENATDR